MGASCSEPASDNEEYRIPPGESYKHQKCTVRAPHQLTILKVPQNYLTSVLLNHFKKWHTAEFDYIRGHT